MYIFILINNLLMIIWFKRKLLESIGYSKIFRYCEIIKIGGG